MKYNKIPRLVDDVCKAIEKGVPCPRMNLEYSSYCAMHRRRLRKYNSFELPLEFSIEKENLNG